MPHIRPISLVIIINRDSVLAEQGFDSNSDTFFYRLLGGGIQQGETSSNCIKRELKEELNLHLKDINLLTVIENIFTYNGELNHEIIFLYTANIQDKDEYDKKIIHRIDKSESFAEWISINSIKSGDITLFPHGAEKHI